MVEKIFRAKRVVFVVVLWVLAIGAAFAEAQPEDEVFVFADGGAHVMKRDVAASGERYVAENDPTTFFWSEGSEATLKIKGREYSKYVLLRGSAEEDELVLTVDGKNYQLKQAVSASGAKYEAVDDPETFFWSTGMRGATLFVKGVEYAGYDDWLPEGGIWLTGQGLPTELEWKVSSIAGSEVIADSTVTLTFHADGSLSGKASVNNYRASWIASGSKLLILRGAVTKMLGSPELMEQETAFLDFLPKAVKFKIRKNGLILVTRDGAEMILESSV